jgi:hypothetical protein
MIVTPVKYPEIPTVNDINFTVPQSTSSIKQRNAIFNFFTLNGSSTITLSTLPYNPYWVEIWHDGWRVLNLDPQNPQYVISQRTITFTTINTGDIVVVIDTEPLPYYAANVIHVTGVQHDANSPVSLRCEPVLLTQPFNGYVRLTADRKNLVYVPQIGFAGTDTFGWSLITQNGQIGPAKCAKITVI